MLKNSLLTFNSIRHLKPLQIKHQLLYRLKKPKTLKEYRTAEIPDTVCYLKFVSFPPVYKSYLGDNAFSFLNIDHRFEKEIDWDFQEYGKLWSYNLQYGNYLLQKDISLDKRYELLKSLYLALEKDKLELEPYPISLRAINVIRLLCIDTKGQKEHDILQNVYAELHFLSKRLEYHILGNHLLENAFALCMGGAFFNRRDWRDKAINLLIQELDEQILADGAHFELSPMYHNIIFFRVLELIDWYSAYEDKDAEFLDYFKSVGAKMAAWLQNIQFKNGDIPLFNDAAKGIAYRNEFLLQYAMQLEVETIDLPLKESGYHSFANDIYEIKVDTAQIGASYQPGHAHADALSFILYHRSKPLFVEQGTSTYNIGDRRNLERSTQAHNTVVVNNRNQSEVWGGFRVAKRAVTSILKKKMDEIVASHDGYKKMGITHTRKFNFDSEGLKIVDSLSNKGQGVFYLHLYPGSTLIQKDKNSFIVNNTVHIHFSKADSFVIENYTYAESYNKYEDGKRIAVRFTTYLETEISF